MTTTEAWVEANEEGTVYIHESLKFVLCRLSGSFGVGWWLFPVLAAKRVDPGSISPPVNLLLASRAADAIIAEGW